MGSVFLILYIIGTIGNYLIIWVNKLSMDKAETAKINTSGDNGLNPAKVAVLTAVVDKVTGGKGRIEAIQKIKS